MAAELARAGQLGNFGKTLSWISASEQPFAGIWGQALPQPTGQSVEIWGRPGQASMTKAGDVPVTICPGNMAPELAMAGNVQKGLQCRFLFPAGEGLGGSEVTTICSDVGAAF